MSLPLIINGLTYLYPETGDVDWGADATDWASAVTSGMLQKAGGTFTLTADVDFGVGFGLKSLYYKSRNANVSSTGQVRLGNTEFIGWRSFANNDDMELAVNASDQLTYNGNPIIPSTALTALRAVATDASGVLTASTTTSTELTYVHGVTSAIQTQLDGKLGTALASAQLLVGNVSNVATAVDITGDVVISNTGVTAISAGVIVNADINASAAIAFSKLASLTSAHILVGSSGNVATDVAVSGDVTLSNAGVTAIVANKVTLGMMAQVATATFLGRTSGSTGNVEALTVTQATALLNNFVGDSGSGGTKGLVPAPAAGDAAALKFLKADGTWSVPVGAGDVVGPASSVASEVVLFDGTTGKLIKRATGTGLVPVSSGVYQTPGALTGDVTTSGAGLATTAAATQANIVTLSKSTGVAVHGTNTNDNAAAGYVGEVVSNNPGAPVTPASSTNYITITSISLTAGDWDVDGFVEMAVGGTFNGTLLRAAISTTTDATDSLNKGGYFSLNVVFNNGADTNVGTGTRRISVASTTTVYLVGRLNYSVLGTTTWGVNSYIIARRAR